MGFMGLGFRVYTDVCRQLEGGADDRSRVPKEGGERFQI